MHTWDKIYGTTTRDLAYLGLSLILEITNILQSLLPDFIFTDMILIIFNKWRNEIQRDFSVLCLENNNNNKSSWSGIENDP